MSDMTAEQAILHIKLGYKCTDPIVGTIAEAFAVLEALSAPRVPDEVSRVFAPPEMDNSESSAWAEGYNQCREDFALLNPAPSPAEPAQDELAKLRERVRELEEALDGLLAIIGDSRGVTGYHLNGEIAGWDEFEEVEHAARLREGGA